MGVASEYIKEARPVLVNGGKDPGWLFPSVRTDRVCGEYLGRMLRIVQERTAEANPDLEELGEKKLSSHSLRVTFATMMFLNGAGIRFINELLLHKNISTTARYTPLELDDLRRACRLAHPRA
jgi:site-specific recombinase XerD